MGKEKITQLKQRSGENRNPWGGQGAEAAWARLRTPAGGKGEAGSDEVRAASTSGVLYMHGVFKNNDDNVLFKGSSHPMLAAAPSGPLPDPWVR